MKYSQKKILDRAYQDFHQKHLLDQDPVHFVHKYSDPRDREVIGVFSALLAYGNVRTILKSVGKVAEALGDRPASHILNHKGSFFSEDFVHRFTTRTDLEIVALWLKLALQKSGSLENFFVQENAHWSTRDLLSDFVRRFCTTEVPAPYNTWIRKRQRSLKYLISDPERGSACKRLNLFLRWMVRASDGIDLGVWTKMSPSKLILPVDTHLLKAVKLLGWSKGNAANWKMAEAATERLRAFCPEDPIRYDFALCHLSMGGGSLKSYFGKISDEKME